MALVANHGYIGKQNILMLYKKTSHQLASAKADLTENVLRKILN